MPGRLAVKRLTASDLTFFEWHFRNEPAGNQKAINLNADVFIQQLYPSLPVIAGTKSGRLPLDLFIFGPGLQGEYNLQRKIVKSGAYKNWRLNGEFIFNPENSPQRFNSLRPGDLVVFDFTGELQPISARAVFIAKSVPEDMSLHAVLDEALGEPSMAAWSASHLTALIERAAPQEEHPINELVLDAALEDAALRGLRGTSRLLHRRSGRKLSREDLKAAAEKADETGWAGECFVNAHLQELKDRGQIRDFQWVSAENAVAPHDFLINLANGTSCFVEVKSTAGEFDRPIHISSSELAAMRDDPARHDIYRVYEIQESMAKLRIAEGVGPFASEVLQVFSALPGGVTPDSVSVDPSILNFSPSLELQMPEEPNGE
jgi:hypothetical protein